MKRKIRKGLDTVFLTSLTCFGLPVLINNAETLSPSFLGGLERKKKQEKALPSPIQPKIILQVIPINP